MVRERTQFRSDDQEQGPKSESSFEIERREVPAQLPEFGESPTESDDSAIREQKLAEIQERLAQVGGGGPTDEIDPELFGDFSPADWQEGKIVLPETEAAQLPPKLEEIKRQDKFHRPSIFQGDLTATNYDSKDRVRNFSTQTRMITTADGKRVFAVNCYPASQLHRFWDGIGRRLAGHRCGKVSNWDWKETFERKSNIPLIENQDPRMVLMPFLPNINLRDLIANNKEISDFGECDWAQDITLEDKQAIIDQAVDKLMEIHGRGEAWGEPILHNMIITKDQRVVICDPEVVYDKDVAPLDQFAGDLYDLTFSSAGSLLKSGDIKDPAQIKDLVSQVLSRYGQKEVIAQLQQSVGKKIGILKKILYQNFEFGRLGVKDFNEYEQIRQAILSYES